MSTPKNKASKSSRAKALAQKQTAAMNIQNYIQKQLQEVVETAPGTAIVNVVVTKFYGLTETTAPFPLTHCKLSMAKPNLSCVEIVDNSVMVTRKGAPVSFQYKISGTATDDTYYPIEISFCPKKKKGEEKPDVSTKSEKVARKKFSTDAMHIYGSSLFFTDSYCADADKLGYRFCLIVQSVKTGEVGVIDPGIGNPGGTSHTDG